jgi:hypothetical protein
MQISAPRQASVGRASRRGSWKQKSAYVWRKTYTFIYPYPIDKKLINPFSKRATYQQQIMINVPTLRSKADFFNQQMSLMEREHSKALTEMEEREEDFVLKLKVSQFLKMLFYAK